MFLQQYREPWAVKLANSRLQGPFEQLFRCECGFYCIQHEKGQHAVGGGSLVSIQEWMILCQRHAVLRGGLIEVFSIGVGLLRLTDCRFQ